MADDNEILIPCPKCGEKNRATVALWAAGFACVNCGEVVQRPRKKRKRSGNSGKLPVATVSPENKKKKPRKLKTAMPETATPAHEPKMKVAAPAPDPGGDKRTFATTHTSLAQHAVEETGAEAHTKTFTDIISTAGATAPDKASLSATVDAVEAERHAYGEEMTHLGNQSAEIEMRLNTIDQERRGADLEDPMMRMGILEAENEVLKEKFNLLIKERVTLSTQVSRLNSQVDELKAHNKTLADAIIPREKMEEIQQRLEHYKEKAAIGEEYKEKARAIRDKYLRLKEDVKERVQAQQQAIQEIDELKKTISELEKEKDEQRERLNKEVEKTRNAEKNSDRLSTELHEIKLRQKALKEEKNQLLEKVEILKRSIVPPEKMAEIRKRLKTLTLENKQGESKFQKLVAQYKKILSEHQAKTKLLQEVSSRHKKLSEQLMQNKTELDLTRKKAEDAMNASREERKKYEARIQELERVKQDLQLQTRQLTDQVIPPEKLEELKDRITKLTVKSRLAERQEAELKKEIEALRQKKEKTSNVNPTEEQARLLKKIDGLEEELAEAKKGGSKNSALEKERAEFQRREKELNATLAQLREEVASQQTKNADLQQEIKELRQAVKQAETQVADSGGDENLDTLKMENKILREKLVKLMAEKKTRSTKK